mmetsp:Transcript_28706/g.78974  ORF Transcript_28706/g.78974 Transcript_28706/m.78974 type:complete len:212 (-) Transcript_28706:2591-3226(-)
MTPRQNCVALCSSRFTPRRRLAPGERTIRSRTSRVGTCLYWASPRRVLRAQAARGVRLARSACRLYGACGRRPRAGSPQACEQTARSRPATQQWRPRSANCGGRSRRAAGKSENSAPQAKTCCWAFAKLGTKPPLKRGAQTPAVRRPWTVAPKISGVPGRWTRRCLWRTATASAISAASKPWSRRLPFCRRLRPQALRGRGSCGWTAAVPT